MRRFAQLPGSHKLNGAYSKRAVLAGNCIEGDLERVGLRETTVPTG